MARLIQNEIKKPLAEAILFGSLKQGGRVLVGVSSDGNALTVEPISERVTN